MKMTSSRPYLLRALHEWILDNSLTPYILVNAEQNGVEVPQQFVDEGKIVLNIAPRAVHGLTIGNDWLSFDARFGGSPMTVQVPVAAVLAVYAKENGQGMVFAEEGDEPPPSDSGPERGRPRLKVVK